MILEKFYVQCLRRILNVNESTCTYMIMGETGCMPLSVDILNRALCFYINTQYKHGNNSLATKMLNSLIATYNNSINESRYLSFISQNLNSIGHTYLFNGVIPYGRSLAQTINQVKRSIKDQALQKWYSDLDNSSKAIFYRTFKSQPKFEPYLDILPTKDRIKVTKFRVSNHRLPIETGRWHGIPITNRTCPKCQTNALGDEFHYLF